MNNIIEYKGYYGSVEFNAEDDVFFGKILGINDLVTFEGESTKGIKKAFADAVDDYLETCKELGKQPDKIYKGSFNVRVPSDLHKMAAIKASSYDITLNQLVKLALQYFISHSKEAQSELERFKNSKEELAC